MIVRDRAAVVSTAMLGIVVDALRQWLRGDPSDLTGVRAQIEDVLRDEFDDIARQTAGERDVIGD